MKFKLAVSALIIAAVAAGCSANGTKPSGAAAAPAPSPAASNNEDLYEIATETRRYVFDDYATYQEFLSVGETPFTLVRIGAGPRGESLVFGLTKHDKEKMSGIASVDMYDGKQQPAEKFYGELLMEDRLYVFGNYADMVTVRNTGEAVFRYTDIGAGPNGMTVVYVLNKGNAEHRPDGLMTTFRSMHKI